MKDKIAERICYLAKLAEKCETREQAKLILTEIQMLDEIRRARRHV